MKNVLFTILMLGMATACNPTAETEQATVAETEVKAENEPVTADKSRFVSIDSDEALIATALMAAPEESRAESNVTHLLWPQSTL